MGSPLVPVLTNIFMCRFGNMCHCDFKNRFRVRLHVTKMKSHPGMKKFLFTREFHPGIKRVQFRKPPIGYDENIIKFLIFLNY